MYSKMPTEKYLRGLGGQLTGKAAKRAQENYSCTLKNICKFNNGAKDIPNTSCDKSVYGRILIQDWIIYQRQCNNEENYVEIVKYIFIVFYLTFTQSTVYAYKVNCKSRYSQIMR